jgi:hypothetical protein
MLLSMNEIETIVTKAAQGRGLDYGVAVEIGAAARWLCTRGFDGITEAVSVLSGAGDSGVTVSRLGLQAVDLAVATARPIPATGCSSPLMLRALASRVDCTVYFDPVTEEGSGAWIVDPDGGSDDLAVTESTVQATPAWEQIDKWAALTNVPSSPHSRSAGAGAGLTDND